MIQTESPYYQPSPAPPAPFTDALDVFSGDPTCSSGETGCDAAWALRIIDSSDIVIGGAGLYSWFQAYDESCVNTQNCQLALVEIADDSGGVYLWNLITIGAVSMIVDNSSYPTQKIPAINNTNAIDYPWWSIINIYEPLTLPSSADNDSVYIDPSIWTDSDPVIECDPPCVIVLPPFPLGYTTTISWGSLTTTMLSVVTIDVTTTITTIISIPDFTATEIPFWAVTVGTADTNATIFYPVQSVMPPSTTIILPPGVALFPPTAISESAWYPVTTASAPSASSSTYVVPLIIPTTSHTATIQPMATISIPISTQVSSGSTTTTYHSAISYSSSSGKPSPTCTHDCGHRPCILFGCGIGSCGLFGCDGSCGIFGCLGCGPLGCSWGCGLGGCQPGCTLEECGGINCENGDCGSGGDDDDDCTDPEEAEICTEFVSSFTTNGALSTTTRVRHFITLSFRVFSSYL